MSQPLKIARHIAFGLVGLIVAVAVAAFMVSQTEWFQNYVRQKIIASTEDSIGGKVEVGSFRFDARHLQAYVTNFLIHGNEPPGVAPFVQVARIQVYIRSFTSIHHLWDITYLGVERPAVNVIVLPDGRTNIPTPRSKTPSKQTPLETVVNLAIGHFDLSNGLISVASQKQNFNLRGENLHAELWYNVLDQGYRGQLSFQPLYVASGRNTPANIAVILPVTLERDRIELRQARITTPGSNLLINASIQDLRNPEISAHLNGNVALADLRNIGELPIAAGSANLPASIQLDANGKIASSSIQVTGLRLALGQSNLEASGPLKAPNGQGSLQFKARLSLRELGQLGKLAARPDGTVLLNGTAQLDANNDYRVKGNIEAENVSLQQGRERIGKINLYSALDADPQSLDLNGIRLSALGGELTGNVSLQDFHNYRIEATLGNFDLRALAQTLGEKPLPYDGVISGPIEAAGEINAPALKSITASARLTIAPGSRGIPLSGRVNAAYDGANNSIAVENSYVALPHSRLTVSGLVEKQLKVSLTTTNLVDFFAATSDASNPPIVLNGGQASFAGTVTGNLAAPRISGQLAADRFTVEGRAFDQFRADAAASSAGAVIRDASLTRGAMRIQVSASVGLRDWNPLPSEPLSVNASVHDGDLADLMALAGNNSNGFSGLLGANAMISGTVGNPKGGASLVATDGRIENQPFDRVQAQLNFSDRLVTVSNTYLTAGAQRVGLDATFEHPRDSFSSGRLQAHVESDQIDLAQLAALQKQRPNTAGIVQLNARLSVTLRRATSGGNPETELLLSSVDGDASVRDLRAEGQDYGNLNLNARTNSQTVRYNLASNFAGSNIRIHGNTQLTPGYPTAADANLSNLPIQRVLVLAHRADIPAKGNLSGAAHFTGTITNPQGNANLELTHATFYNEPIDAVRAQVTYLAQSIDVPQFTITAGPSRIDLSARYDHRAGSFEVGNLQFRVTGSRIDLARIKNVQERRPGLGGSVSIQASGATEIRPNEPRLLIHDLNADVRATGLATRGKNFGNLALTANTTAGRLNFALDSDLAGASIHAGGNAQLAANYPLDAQLTFRNLTWARLEDLMGRADGEPARFDALADGQLSLRGPLLNADQLSGSLQLTRLEASSIATAPRVVKTVLLQNEGPISATLDHGVVRIANAHVTGPQTDFQASGMVPLHNQTMNVALNGNLNLALLQRFDQDITSSGGVTVSAAARGTLATPRVTGRVELHNGSFNYATIPNGISKANGVILFSGSSASISNLTAESGGGKIKVSGFAALGDNVRFGLKADAANVRVLVNEGASITAGAAVDLTGTTQSSLISGTVTINQVIYSPQTDIGSLLTQAAPGIQAAAVPSPLLDKMRLDLRVRSSSSLTVQASLAENLQIDAELRVRGTAANPGVLGRVTIDEGKLVFFGSTYTVNTGTIGFYNPVRIEPVLNLSLETQAKGVDVVVRVTGPVDNMKLSYTSDPPLQFQEIVALLAAGTTPTSDPNILVNQPSPPAQGFQQMGESALVTAAVADPVASRLQRVFGVSQLKIDPSFTNGSQLPQAQLTLQQRVADNITFTYVTALDNSNSETIEVDVALSPRWSANATRDYNGIFSINLLYKKEFR